MGPRAALSQVLIAGGFVLLVAIGVGIAMGNHVLGQIAEQDPIAPTPVPIPTPTGADAGNQAGWKHLTILSVATDPGFPDPRITPEPEAPPEPKRTPTPKPSPTPTPAPEIPYTSPPMPIPMPSEGQTPEVEASGSRPANAARTSPPARATLPPARATLPPVRVTLPPVVGPSLNP